MNCCPNCESNNCTCEKEDTVTLQEKFIERLKGYLSAQRGIPMVDLVEIVDLWPEELLPYYIENKKQRALEINILNNRNHYDYNNMQ